MNAPAPFSAMPVLERPLGRGFIDYPRRKLGLGAYLDLTGDRAVDMARMHEFYSAKRGRHPQHQGPIRLRDEPPAPG